MVFGPDPRSAMVGQPPVLEIDQVVINTFFKPFVKLGPNGEPIIPPAPDLINRTPGIVAGTSICIAVVFLATAARLAVRLFSRQISIGWDDYVIIPGAIMALARFIICLVGIALGGGGNHVQAVTYAQFAWVEEHINSSTWLYWLSIGFVKISVTLFFYRLVGGKMAPRAWKLFLNVFLVLNILFTILTILFFVRCGNPRHFFSLIWASKHPAKCIDFIPLNLGFSILHCIFDFVIFFAALVFLWGKKFSAMKKLRLLILFSAAFATVFTSVYRIATSFSPSGAGAYDFTYSVWVSLKWAFVDTTLSYLVVSLPVPPRTLDPDLDDSVPSTTGTAATKTHATVDEESVGDSGDHLRRNVPTTVQRK